MNPFAALNLNGRVVAGVLGLLLLVGLVVAVMAWGDARYREGVKDTDAKWIEAGRRLEDQARKAGTVADRREAERIGEHTAQVAKEREKIDEAVAAGDSPLDVLFGGVR